MWFPTICSQFDSENPLHLQGNMKHPERDKTWWFMRIVEMITCIHIMTNFWLTHFIGKVT